VNKIVQLAARPWPEPSTPPPPFDFGRGKGCRFENGSTARASTLARANVSFSKHGCQIFHQPIANIGEPLDFSSKSAHISAGVYPRMGHFAMAILGIDPGAHGAIAVLDELGVLLAVHDMPSTEEASGRPATNAPLLAAILKQSDTRVAYCEFVGARPTDAKVAAFAFGRARGVIEGVVGALGLPIVFLTPPTWKRIADIPPGVEHKDLARTRAIARWPTRADLFARKIDVDRAEACLIAIAGLRREAGR
jgi:crossover junction endodeoxyribonuclease RuvC